MLFSSRELIRLGLASCKWPSTQGMIVDATDESFTTDGVDRWTSVSSVSYNERTHVYQYQVDGRMYQSNTYCFGGHVDRAGAAYHIGTGVIVFYDPDNPERAVLKRGMQFGAIVGILPLTGGSVLALHFLLSR